MNTKNEKEREAFITIDNQLYCKMCKRICGNFQVEGDLLEKHLESTEHQEKLGINPLIEEEIEKPQQKAQKMIERRVPYQQMRKFFIQWIRKSITFEQNTQKTSSRYQTQLLKFCEFLVEKKTNLVTSSRIIEFLQKTQRVSCLTAMKFLRKKLDIIFSAEDLEQLRVLQDKIQKRKTQSPVMQDNLNQFFLEVLRSDHLIPLLTLLSFNKLQLKFEQLFQLNFNDLISEYVTLKSYIAGKCQKSIIKNSLDLIDFCQFVNQYYSIEGESALRERFSGLKEEIKQKSTDKQFQQFVINLQLSEIKYATLSRNIFNDLKKEILKKVDELNHKGQNSNQFGQQEKKDQALGQSEQLELILSDISVSKQESFSEKNESKMNAIEDSDFEIDISSILLIDEAEPKKEMKSIKLKRKIGTECNRHFKRQNGNK